MTTGVKPKAPTPAKRVPKTKRPELPAQSEDPTRLRPTDVEGVFLNSLGIPVNKAGVALSLGKLREAEDAHYSTLVGGAIDSPAKFLKAVALDPKTPKLTRIDAAKAAAPYYDRKMPMAIDGGLDPDGKAVPLFDPAKMRGLSTEELRQLQTLIKKGGLSE